MWGTLLLSTNNFFPCLVQSRQLERSHSGRVQRFTKPPCQQWHREFESRPLRHADAVRHGRGGSGVGKDEQSSCSSSLRGVSRANLRNTPGVNLALSAMGILTHRRKKGTLLEYAHGGREEF